MGKLHICNITKVETYVNKINILMQAFTKSSTQLHVHISFRNGKKKKERENSLQKRRLFAIALYYITL